MAKSKDVDLGLDDLGLNDINFDLDPVEDKRKPVTKVTTSFGKAMADELKSMKTVKTLAIAALPTGYGKAITTLDDISTASKKLYSAAATELRPIVPDVKRAVQKILPRTEKMLPKSVQDKLAEFSKDEESGSGAPSGEDQQNGEIASTLATIFKTQMEYGAEVKATDNAYQQLRNQVQDDQFRRQQGALAVIANATQRLAQYQDVVASSYQRKSLELQYRQYFATKELLKITALGTANTLAELRAVRHNTALPDFAKSTEFQKVEQTLAKKLAMSWLPGSQKFLNQYFSNFTDQLGGKVRDNVRGFIDAVRGIQDVNSMTEGMDKHTLAGDILGRTAAEWATKKFGSKIKGQVGKSKLVQRLGHRLNYQLTNLPSRLNWLAKDRTDNTEKHGAVLGTLMNLARDLLPQIGEGSHVVGQSTLLKGQDPVPFNYAARQALVEVIPGFLSRIHHELVVMRTGNPNVERLSWNPTKGSFTSTKALAKDVYKNVYKKEETARFERGATDFLGAIDKHGKLSKEAREAIKEKLVADSLSGTPFDVRSFMENLNASNDVRSEVSQHFRKTFKVGSNGEVDWKKSNAAGLSEATSKHTSAVTALADNRERVKALVDAGYGDELRAMGVVTTNEDGEYVLNRQHLSHVYLGKVKSPEFKDVYKAHAEGLRDLGGMAGAATGVSASAIDAHVGSEAMESMRAAAKDFEKTADAIIAELKEGSLVIESRKQLEVLGKILEVVETRNFSSADMSEILKRGDAAAAKIHKVMGDGTAWVKDKYGKLKQVRLSDVMDTAKEKLRSAQDKVTELHGQAQDYYHEILEKHGDKLANLPTKAREKFIEQKQKAMLQAQKIAEKAGTTYHDFLDEHGELIKGSRRRAVHEALKARHRAKSMWGKAGNAYRDYMNRKPEGLVGHVGHFLGSTAGIVGKVGMGVGKAGWGAAKIPYHLARLSGKLGWGTLKGVGSIAGGIGRGILGAGKWLVSDQVDVFVPRQKDPVLYAKFMKLGRYVDAKTGKKITGYRDIKGAVRDTETNEIVLTDEEYAGGLYDWRMKRLFKGIGGGIAGITTWLAKVSLVYPFKVGLAMAKAPLKALGAVRRFFTYDTDIYVGGEDKPRLYANKMRMGQYVLADNPKQVVHKASDIKGPVKDLESGNIVLTKEDLDRGIFNSLGHNLTRTIRGAWKLTVGLAKLPFTVGKFAWDVGTGLLKGAGTLLTGGLKGLANKLRGKGGTAEVSTKIQIEQLGIQQGIFRLLHERLKGTKKGARVGSWESKFLKTEEEEEKAKSGGTMKDAVDHTSKQAAAAVSGIGSMFGDLEKKIKGIWDDAKGVKDTFSKGKNILKGAKDVKRLMQLRKLAKAGQLGEEGMKELGELEKGAQWMKGGRVGGWINKGWQAGKQLLGKGSVVGEAAEGVEGAATAAEAVGGAATAAEGVAAAGTVAAEVAGGAAVAGEVAAGATAVAAGIISAPVLLTVGAVIAVAAGAYLLWKWYKNRGPKDLFNVRMAQYGIQKGNDREIKKVLALEGTLLKHVTFSGTQASINTHGIDVNALLKDFGVNLKDKQAMQSWSMWYQQRFKPIFVNSISALKGVNSSITLHDADDKLKPKDKLKFLDELKKMPHAYYQCNANPFGGQKKWWFFGDVGNIDSGWHNVDVAIKAAEAVISKEAAKDKSGDDKAKEPGAGKAAAAAGGAAAAVAGAKEAAKASEKKEVDGGAFGFVKNVVGAELAGLKAAATAVGWIAGGVISLVGSVLGIKTIHGNVLTANQCIRYRQYGLVDLDQDKVKTLFMLETDVLDKSDFDPKGAARFDGDPGWFFDRYCSYFGIQNTDKDGRKVWTDWFQARFLPTLLQYATAVHEANPNVKIGDAERYLKPDQLLNVAKAVVGAKSGKAYGGMSVWAFTLSPWPKYKLNADVKSTDANMDYLTDQVNKAKFDEKVGIAYKADGGNGDKSKKGKADQGIAGGTTDATKDNNGPNVFQRMWSATKSGASSVYQKVTGTAPAPTGTAGNIGGAGGAVNQSGRVLEQPGNGTGGDINKVPMPGQGASWASAAPTITAAAKMAGVDPVLLGTIAGIESGYNPSIKAGTSSATGYFQFIDSTWKTMIARYGKKYGINPGTPQTDPRANALMGAEYVKENIAYLKKSTGLTNITDTDAYLAHFLGAGGASQLLKADKNGNAAQLFPAAARANASIFFDKGRPRTVQQIIDLMDKKMASHRPSGAGLTAAPPANGKQVTTPGASAPAANDASNGMASTGKGAPSPASSGPSTAPANAAMASASGTAASAAPTSVPSSGATSIASAPVPDITSGTGGSSAGGGGPAVSASSGAAIQAAQASDAVARQSVQQSNAAAGGVADILSQSLQVQTSMDATLKAILQALANGAANGNSSGAGPGNPSSSAPGKPSSPMTTPPVDVTRKVG
jgi:hypothetical protein